MDESEGVRVVFPDEHHERTVDSGEGLYPCWLLKQNPLNTGCVLPHLKAN